ncbi:hypothetical protein [Promicromonospora sp. NPDC059942]|uniref:hypothetical protein n=1 Tax=Promicromonospora sp. NPDC059942 TaxID=3347009 RepID=UPI0036562AAE
MNGYIEGALNPILGSEGLGLHAGFFVIVGLTLAVLVWAAIELWRKPVVAERMTDSILQMRMSQGNDRVARAMTRAFLPGVLMMGSLWVATGSAFLDEKYRSTVLEIGLAGVLVSLVLIGSVALFNWPRFLAPPHMRGDRSLFARE